MTMIEIKEACREAGIIQGNCSFSPWAVVLLIYGVCGFLHTRNKSFP